MAVAVVVPAHDEEALVGRTVASLPDFVDHVIVVDDGSVDRTAERAALAALGRAGFSLVVHGAPQGVGAAVLSGYRRALQLEAEVVVVVGADGRMDPADMPRLLDPLRVGGTHYAKGNRLGFPGAARTMPLASLVRRTVVSLLARLTSGYWHLWDSQCGYTAIRREALGALDLATVSRHRGYAIDLLALLNAEGLSVVDVPVRPSQGRVRRGRRALAALVPTLLLLVRSGLRRAWRRHGSARPRLARPAADQTA